MKPADFKRAADQAPETAPASTAVKGTGRSEWFETLIQDNYERDRQAWYDANLPELGYGKNK